MTQASANPPRKRVIDTFLARFLNPIDLITEAIYAVLIVMTFTMAYRAIDTSAFESSSLSQLVTNLAIAAFGCALAWGIIDGAMYVLLSLLGRGQSNRMLRLVKSAPDEKAGVDAIAGELDSSLEPIMPEGERQDLYRLAYARLRDNEPRRVGFQRDDFIGALGTVLVAVLASLPVILPLLIFRSYPEFALRLSNLLAIIMLFLFGYRWAKYSGSSPLKLGFALAAFGVAIVIVAIPLGG